MFSRIMLVVLLLIGIVFGQVKFAKIDSGTHVWFRSVEVPTSGDGNWYYVDIDRKINSFQLPTSPMQDNIIKLDHVSPSNFVIWYGSPTARIREFSGITRYDVILYNGAFVLGADKIVPVYFKNYEHTEQTFLFWSSKEVWDSVTIAAGWFERADVLRNSTAKWLHNEIPNIQAHDRIIADGGARIDGKVIDFKVTNKYGGTVIVWFTNGNGNVESKSVAFAQTVLFNYCKFPGTVWIGTNKIVQSPSLSNGDHLEIVQSTTVEEPMEHMFLLSVYPNPFRAKVTLNINRKADIEIYSLDGRKVACFKNTKRINWDASRESSGIYFAKIMDSELLSKKIYLVK